MRRTSWPRAGVALAVLVLLAACSDDDSADPTSTTATTEAGEAPGDDPSPPDDAAGTVFALTSEEICSGLDAAELGAATGLSIDPPEASEFDTPQCTYPYTSTEGAFQTITVASMRPADVGDRAGDDAFDHVLEVNRGLGGVTDEAEVDAGDRAVRLAGDALNLGVVAVGDRIFTVIVPGGEGSAATTEATLQVVAEQLAP